MSDDELFNNLKNRIDKFSNERDWAKFHTPKNLSMALAIEASELMEIFQWSDSSENYASLSEEKKKAVEYEVADVFIYLMRFCSISGIDVFSAVNEKLSVNSEKYPVSLAKGNSKKYTEY